MNAIFRFPRVLPAAHHLESHEETFPVQLEDSDQWRVGRWSRESSTYWWVRHIGLINGGSFCSWLAAKTRNIYVVVGKKMRRLSDLWIIKQLSGICVCEWVRDWVSANDIIFLRTVYLPQFPWPSIQIAINAFSWSPCYGRVSSSMGTPLLDWAHNHAQSLFVKCLPRTNFMSRAGIVSRENVCVLQCAALAMRVSQWLILPAALSIRLKGVWSSIQLCF